MAQGGAVVEAVVLGVGRDVTGGERGRRAKLGHARRPAPTSRTYNAALSPPTMPSRACGEVPTP